MMREFPNRIAQTEEVTAKTIYRQPTNEGVRSRQHRATRCRNIGESVDEVAVELEWTGFLSLLVMGLAAGSEMKAFVVVFLRHEISHSHEYLGVPTALDLQTESGTSIGSGVRQVRSDHSPAVRLFLIHERETYIGISAAKADGAHDHTGVTKNAGSRLLQGGFVPASRILSGFRKNVISAKDCVSESCTDEFWIYHFLHRFSVEGGLSSQPFMN